MGCSNSQSTNPSLTVNTNCNTVLYTNQHFSRHINTINKILQKNTSPQTTSQLHTEYFHSSVQNTQCQ